MGNELRVKEAEDKKISQKEVWCKMDKTLGWVSGPGDGEGVDLRD